MSRPSLSCNRSSGLCAWFVDTRSSSSSSSCEKAAYAHGGWRGGSISALRTRFTPQRSRDPCWCTFCRITNSAGIETDATNRLCIQAMQQSIALMPRAIERGERGEKGESAGFKNGVTRNTTVSDDCSFERKRLCQFSLILGSNSFKIALLYSKFTSISSHAMTKRVFFQSMKVGRESYIFGSASRSLRWCISCFDEQHVAQ